ncbi:hypothetical protein NW762_010349 [Fusarium torreyae]|uniref:Uncharacterized protein n=1 Tax=Fusarium torreyae TaxID=1237075 RepID=A0A9W8VBR6_9HYPO|nr:hypothetical protein NW762_010349 [Fusarium torreyae]
MAGPRHIDQQRIVVRPSVWIRTTDEAIRNRSHWKKLERKIKDLGLNSVEYAAIYVEGGLRLATIHVPNLRGGLNFDHGFEFPDGNTLYAHVSMQPFNLSACGMVCLVTVKREDTILYQGMSRIGGVICCNDTTERGITSGHAMLYYFLQTNEQLSETTPENLGSDHSGFDSELSDEGGSDDEDDLVENHGSDGNIRECLGAFRVNEVDDWVPITPTGTIYFVDRATILAPNLVEVSSSSAEPIPRDFALVSSMDRWLGENSYLWHGTKRVIHHWFWDDELPKDRQRVLILFDAKQSPAPGFFIPSIIPLVIGGALFLTRKVCLDAPLSQGTSGSWVVDQETGGLCGSIIAVFDQEPYALMITSETLFLDIMRGSRGIVSIHLPRPKPDFLDEGIVIEPVDKGKAKVQEGHAYQPWLQTNLQLCAID